MSTIRERLQHLLDDLPDDQVETVLHFTEAISKGRVVVGTCELPESTPGQMPRMPLNAASHDVA
jgi:hypothetical protein